MSVSIQKAVAEDDYILHLMLTNGNEMTLNVKPLLQCALFAPLADEATWKSMHANSYSLFWEVDNPIEISIDTILNYFA